jgi:hypothetical protein
VEKINVRPSPGSHATTNGDIASTRTHSLRPIAQPYPLSPTPFSSDLPRTSLLGVGHHVAHVPGRVGLVRRVRALAAQLGLRRRQEREALRVRQVPVLWTQEGGRGRVVREEDRDRHSVEGSRFKIVIQTVVVKMVRLDMVPRYGRKPGRLFALAICTQGSCHPTMPQHHLNGQFVGARTRTFILTKLRASMVRRMSVNGKKCRDVSMRSPRYPNRGASSITVASSARIPPHGASSGPAPVARWVADGIPLTMAMRKGLPTTRLEDHRHHLTTTPSMHAVLGPMYAIQTEPYLGRGGAARAW